MVSDAHPTPWFAHTASREVEAEGPILAGDQDRWVLLPVTDQLHGARATLDVRLLARVSLLDDRGCLGPAGNATAYGEIKYGLSL